MGVGGGKRDDIAYLRPPFCHRRRRRREHEHFGEWRRVDCFQISAHAQTKAVFSVPFNHSVPVRIGLGLSKVGTTIALTSLTDLVLLLGIWLCVNLRPVREFCLFAAVVIITDWFMLHTFFLTASRMFSIPQL